MSARAQYHPVDAGGVRWAVKPIDIILSSAAVVMSVAAGGVVADRYGEAAAALIFMLGVTVAGAVGGLVCALLASVAAFLIFNFLVSEPVLILRIATGRDLAPLVAFSLCAVVTGVLAGRLRDQSEAARASNAQLRTLLELSRALQSAARIPDIAETLERTADPLLGARVALFRLRDGELDALGPSGDNEEVRKLAASAMVDGERVVTTKLLTAIRLDGAEGPLGVLVLRGSRVRQIDLALLHAVGNMVALALERADLSERIAEQKAVARTEELKTALLSSVSHDFRTPLTAIAASASSLLAYGDRLDGDTSSQFLHRIVNDCERLNRYTANLLEMSKLEAGHAASGLHTLGVAEMLGVAVQRMRGRAGDRTIRTAIADPDLLVRANPSLFELVLINVLENAILYSEDGTEIVVAARSAGAHCEISIADEGCGIPDADRDRVFDRFYRVHRAEASPRGSGLGLAIAKGFVEALDGTIEARTPGIRLAGTEIVIRLPLAQEVAQ